MAPFNQTSPDAHPSDSSRASNQDSDQQYIIVPIHQDTPQRAPAPSDSNLLHQNAGSMPESKPVKNSRRSLLHDLASELEIGLENHQKANTSDFPPRSSELQFPLTATNNSRGISLNRSEQTHPEHAGSSWLYSIQQQPRDAQFHVPSQLPAFVTWDLLLLDALITFSCLAFNLYLVCEVLFLSLFPGGNERVGDGARARANPARSRSYRPRTKRGNTEVEHAALEKAKRRESGGDGE
ncbi:uncharacterized protein Z520_03983 [Fonsecaea multimorphosa CBS 102226]|uniref:Uncharacterized protein n=1 Tax=Fonsecaea multimorphosa CBS 102226 TaxID=1442371 RepID=A0A0D2K391_9EURO|nr:uncharacterized protein Z520_03983 [Fonsecaea multimorphosa CBS 102226]KIY00298.1 hypothetical protein Z520_03983 [Fonsecaea multimorphosa CBS 102226]OAL27131.1 hypothetical protein AYO22_03762 [Fonsecaea multimorphosa]